MRVRQKIDDAEICRRLKRAGRCRAKADGAGQAANDALSTLFVELEHTIGSWSQVATESVMGWRSKLVLHEDGIALHLMDREMPRFDELELVVVPCGAYRYLVRSFADNTLQVVVGTRNVARMLDRLIGRQLDAVLAEKATVNR